jgi:F-type H+-transporting ATPase subunit epsilon
MAEHTYEATGGIPVGGSADVKVTRQLRCVVVTPERAVLDEPADFVALPLYDGELGVLPGRLPLIGRLGFGEMRLVRGQRTRRYYVDGGFAQVRNNVVTILTARALTVEEISVDAAREALQNAQHTIATTPEAQAAQERQRERARAQLRIAGHGLEPAGVGH